MLGSKKKFIFMLVIILFFNTGFASLEDEIRKHMNRYGLRGNINGPGAYKGQSSRYYTGGPTYLRAPEENYQIASVTMPKMSIGECGAIDIYGGGFSLIDSQQIIDAMKKIGANAQGYLFSLALSKISPEIQNKIEEMYSMSNHFNYFNINSCQAAKQMINRTISILQNDVKQSCVFSKIRRGESRDYAKAYHSCQSNKEMAKENKNVLDDDKDHQNTMMNINITWEAINEDPLIKNLDPKLKYLIMSLVGTIIISTEDSDHNNKFKPKQETFASIIDKDTIKALRSGGEVTVYECEGGVDCLKINKRIQDIPADKSYYAEIEKKLKKILDNIKNGNKSSPTPEETEEIRTLINTNVIPIYRILAVESAFSRGDASLVNISTYSEILAEDLIYRMLDKNINKVLSNIATKDMPQKYKNEMYNMIKYARELVNNYHKDNFLKIKEINELILKTELMEKKLYSSMSSQMINNVNWGS